MQKSYISYFSDFLQRPPPQESAVSTLKNLMTCHSLADWCVIVARATSTTTTCLTTIMVRRRLQQENTKRQRRWIIRCF